MTTRTLFLFGVFASLSAASAHAQPCSGHWESFISSSPDVFPPWDMVSWDPDGAGPLDEWLVVVGSFPSIGGVSYNGIAGWDGTQWHSIGAGVGGPPNWRIDEVIVHNGEIVVCGWFSTAGGVSANSIARWDGSKWNALGSGLNSSCEAIHSFGGELYAAGNFTHAGGQLVNYIARWDGTTWHDMDGGMDIFAVGLGDYKGELIATGLFSVAGGVPASQVAAWNGSAWQALGGGSSNALWTSPVTYDSKLVVATRGIDVWDGLAWGTVGAADQPIEELIVHDGWLIAGGDFGSVGGVQTRRVAAWNGRSWSSMSAPVSDSVTGLAVFNGDLVMCAQSREIKRWICDCYADCDQSTGTGVLDIFDFLCWQGHFVIGGPYACDCDTSTGNGVCDVFDFLCFQNAFVGGCP